jgi:thiamine-phosphate pyrophosphorylase
MSDLHERIAAARLYLVCPARPGGREPEPFLTAAIAGGVDVVQLRDKDATEEELLRAGARFGAVCCDHDVPFIVNDRPDLAVELEADGVHLGQDDMPVERARAIVGPDRIVGLSTHTPAEVDAATGVDYVAVGPVHATPTKPGRPAAGLELVRHAAAHARVPWFAIGGLDAGNAGDVVVAGARRIVVVRALTAAPDPEAAARALLVALEEPVGSAGA